MNNNSEKINKALKEKMCKIEDCKGKQISYVETDCNDIIQIYTDGTYSSVTAAWDYDDAHLDDSCLSSSDVVGYFANTKTYAITNLGKEFIKVGTLSERDLMALQDERNETTMKNKEFSISTKALGIKRYIEDLEESIKEVNKPITPSTADTLFECIKKIEEQLAEYGKHGIEI